MTYPESDSEHDRGLHPSPSCATLRACAEEHCDGRISDALCVFLQTHLCICDRESSSPHNTPALRALNDAFAEKMAEVSASYKLRSDGNELKKLSTLWVDAFNAYLDRTPFVVVLARMAVAHILGDLECVLFLNPVTREEYDRVYDDIADCVARLSRGLVQHGNFLEILYGLMQPVVDPARNYAIWMMRSLAWDLYQQRLRLSQR